MKFGVGIEPSRDGAVHAWGIPGWMAHLLPDQWNNVAAISRSHPPLLAEVRHGCRQKTAKSFKISSGYVEVYTTFSIQFERLREREAQLLQ